ncbi:MAG: STAS domain-containing protein [Deltaproteobacteria bacterium]|nr:STAS domain-containing protein [Deltaproteobacteria bacterium]
MKELHRNGQDLTAGLEGRLDAMSADEFTRQMEVWFAAGLKNFAIDCSHLDYISSAGLRALLMAAKKLKSLNGSFKLAALQESVDNVFKISGFDKIIPIAATLDDACKS